MVDGEDDGRDSSDSDDSSSSSDSEDSDGDELPPGIREEVECDAARKSRKTRTVSADLRQYIHSKFGTIHVESSIQGSAAVGRDEGPPVRSATE